MATNTILDEVRTARIDVDLPFCRQLRLSPALKAILQQEKPDTLPWPEFIVAALVTYVLVRRLIQGELHSVNRLIVRLVGALSDRSEAELTNVRSVVGRHLGGGR